MIGGKIAETAMFFDIPHLMIQTGLRPFHPETGRHLVQPGPITHDGLMFEKQDPEQGRLTKKAIEKAMKNEPSIDWLLENQEDIIHKYYQMGLDKKL